MTRDELKLGDEVFYVLPRSPSNRRDQDLYVSVTVIGIGQKMIRIKHINWMHTRNTVPRNLVKTPPEGAWIK